MARSAWEKLGDDLNALDEWGDFGADKTRATRNNPRTWIWLDADPHPVHIMVNGAVSLQHFNVYLPTLLRALDEPLTESELAMVVRALTKKGLFVAVEKLLRLYTNEDLLHDSSLLWTVGNAIYTIYPRDHLDESIRICRDSRLGHSRQRLIVHLSRYKKSEEALQTLLALLDDESVRGAALEGLKRYGDIRAIPAIERTPVRDGDEGIYESHQKMTALKKLNEKKSKQDGSHASGGGR